MLVLSINLVLRNIYHLRWNSFIGVLFFLPVSKHIYPCLVHIKVLNHSGLKVNDHCMLGSFCFCFGQGMLGSFVGLY